MPSVLAIVSKAQFENLARSRGSAQPGDRLELKRYESRHRGLEPLADGGDLFLVTVRPPDEALWLVSVLPSPRADVNGWGSSHCDVPITDISALKTKLKFSSGKGITAKSGALGMSLQTPRELSADDVELLRRAIGGGSKAQVRTGSATPRPVNSEPVPPAAKRSAASKPAKQAIRPAAPARSRTPRSSDGSLSPALSALQSREPERALELLLAIWREQRLPEIAELVERLSDQLGVRRAEPQGKRVKDKVAHWKQMAEAANVADFAPLARTLFLTNSGRDVGERLEMLAEWPADPRLASQVHLFLEQVNYTASSARPFWRSVFQVLNRVADPRSVPALEAAEQNFAQVFRERDDYRDWIIRQCRKGVQAITEANASAPAALSTEEQSTLDDMRAALEQAAKPSEGALELSNLYAEVYANPSADGPRLVLADVLQEASDPRGEFIVLDFLARDGGLDRSQKHRRKELLEAHSDEWIGELTHWTRKSSREFERGFLSACWVERANAAIGTLPVESPIWSTVRSLSGVCSAELLAHAPSVVSAAWLPAGDLWGFLANPRKPLGLERLRVSGAWTDDDLAKWLVSEPPAALKRLDLFLSGRDSIAPGAWHALATGKLGGKLDCFDFFDYIVGARVDRTPEGSRLTLRVFERYDRSEGERLFALARQADFVDQLRVVLYCHAYRQANPDEVCQETLQAFNRKQLDAIASRIKNLKHVEVEARVRDFDVPFEDLED